MSDPGWWRLVVALGACASIPRAPAAAPTEVLACIDLPRDDPRSHNLSGLAWDGATGRLYAVSDREQRLMVLRPRDDLRAVDLEEPIRLALDWPKWDGEGVARAGGGGFYVASEVPAAIFVVDAAGRETGRVALPAHFQRIRANFGIESLGVTPDGRDLFVANEEALEGDGPLSTPARGTTVRILRRDLATGAELEVAYRTEPIFAAGPDANCGVSDVTPLSAGRVLVTERAFVTGRGNAVQLYIVDLEGAEDVAGVAALGDDHAAVAKRLLVDLATLPAGACSPPPGPQRSPILENYEGVALGPTLPDGRQVLFAISDDNARADQVPRLLVLAVRF